MVIHWLNRRTAILLILALSACTDVDQGSKDPDPAPVLLDPLGCEGHKLCGEWMIYPTLMDGKKTARVQFVEAGDNYEIRVEACNSPSAVVSFTSTRINVIEVHNTTTLVCSDPMMSFEGTIRRMLDTDIRYQIKTINGSEVLELKNMRNGETIKLLRDDPQQLI